MKFSVRNNCKSLLVVTSILALTGGIALMADAKKISTKISAPKDSSSYSYKFRTYPHQKTEYEKVNDCLTFMAYDKKAGASQETFFVDNGSEISLAGIELEISYYTTQGKLIHKRAVEISQEFPAKETRKVDIATWDKQKSYYYINSVPSTKGSTPYTVSFRVLSFIEA